MGPLVVGLVVLLATAWANNWGNIQGITAGVLAFLQPYWDLLIAILDRFITQLLPPLRQAWQTLVQVWQTELGPALAELWAAFGQLFTEIFGGGPKVDLLQAALVLLKLALDGVVSLVQALTPAIQLAAEVMVFMIGQVKTSIDNFIRFKQGVEGVIEAVRRLIEKVKNLAAELIDMAIPDWLTPGSPTPFELGLRGIAGAIDDMPEFPGLNGAGGTAAFGAGGGGASFGSISIIINGAGDPAAVGQEVERRLQVLFGQAATQAF